MKATKIANGILAVALAAAMMFPTMSVFAQEDLGEDVGVEVQAEASGDVGTSGELPGFTTELHKSTDGNGKIAEIDEMDIDTKLYFVIYMATLTDIKADIEYAITLPNGIAAPTATADFPISMMIENKNVEFAKIKATKDTKELKISFIDFDKDKIGHTDEDCALKRLADVYMYFGCNLDEAGLVKEGDQGKVSITMPDSSVVKFIVSDFKPQAPSLEKAVGNVDKDGEAIWTVTYTNAVGAYDAAKLPDKLVDTLPEELEYIAASAEVTVGEGVKEKATVVVKDVDGKKQLEYTLPADLGEGKKVVLEYQTKLSNKAMSDIWGAPDGTNTYTNSVVGKKDDDSLISELKAEKGLVISKDLPIRKMLSKDGVVSADKRSIDWTVTVNTASCGFKHLYVIDTMGKGLTLSGDVSVNGAVTAVASATVDDKKVMTIMLVDAGNPTLAEQTYTIKYKTSIDPKYFDPNATDKPSEEDVSNSARLDYSWLDGEGPGEADLKMPPSIGKGPGATGFSQELIKKEYIGEYDKANRKFTWKITVNPNKVNLTKASIVDDLTGKDMLFYLDENNKTSAEDAIKSAIKTASGIDATDFSLTETKLLFKLSNIGTNTFSFNIETYVGNPEFWAANVASKEYKNEVVMVETDTTIGGVALSEDKTGNATKEITHTVLEKSHAGYNAVTNELTWKLVVNKDGVALGDVELTDLLPAGASYVAGSVVLAGNTGAVLEDNSTDEIVKFEISGVNETETITFKTKVDVNTDEFKTKADVEFKNTAKMTSGANSAETVSNTSAAVINNNVMKKAFNASGNEITYTVEINPNGMKLNASGELTFTDKLDSGLLFDSTSFKLYEGNRSDNVSISDGEYVYKLAKGNEITGGYTVKENPADNSFIVTLPTTENASYVAEYLAYAAKGGEVLNNNVALGNSVLGGGENSKAVAGFTYNAGGGGTLAPPAEKFITIKVENTFDDNGTKKPMPEGVEFELILDGDVIGKLVTDKNGVAEVTFSKAKYMSSSRGLRMRQLSVPPNFNIIGGKYEYDIPENAITGANAGKVIEVPVENKPEVGNPGGEIVPPTPPTPPVWYPSYSGGSSALEEELEDTEVVDVVINPIKPVAPPITDIPKTGLEDYLAAYIVIMLLAVFNGFVLIAKQVKKVKKKKE